MESSASLSLSASKDFGGGQITLSPRFQSKGIALCTRLILVKHLKRVKFRPYYDQHLVDNT